MLKEIIVGISIHYFNDTKCLVLHDKLFEKYTCYYDDDVNVCCKTLIKDFYGNLYNGTIENKKCYTYQNKTMDLECKELTTKYHLFVYFMGFLGFIIFIIFIAFFIGYLINKRKQRLYNRIRNSRLVFLKRNPMYEPYENNEYNDDE